MYKYIKLANNFHLVINSVKRFKTELRMTFSSGGAYFEDHDEKGLTHLLEHLEIKQTSKQNPEELNKLLFEKDISRNASTSILTKEIFVGGHKDDLNLMLDMILEFSFTPTITEETLHIEKEIILRELAQRKGDPGYKLNRLVNEIIFKKGSKNLTDIGGDENLVANATIKQLQNLHKKILSRSHFILSIVGGGINEKELVKKTKKYLPILESNQTHPIDQNGINKIHDFKYKPIVSELAHDHCIINFALPAEIHYVNRSVRQILGEMLFFYPQGEFYRVLREELGLVYSVDFSFDKSLQMIHIFLVGEIGNANRLVEETNKILLNYEKFITEEKVEIIKNLFIKRQEIASDNPYQPVDFFVDTMLGFGVEETYEQFIKIVKETSFEDILGYAEKLNQSLKDMKIVIVSKDKSIEKLKF
jgi:predicted Zn-dependent peptidase